MVKTKLVKQFIGVLLGCWFQHWPSVISTLDQTYTPQNIHYFGGGVRETNKPVTGLVTPSCLSLSPPDVDHASFRQEKTR